VFLGKKILSFYPAFLDCGMIFCIFKHYEYDSDSVIFILQVYAPERGYPTTALQSPPTTPGGNGKVPWNTSHKRAIISTSKPEV
jgi:hypothetical protein